MRRSLQHNRRQRIAHRERSRLIVSASVRDFIVQTATESPDVETGGILMGPPNSPSGTVVVTHASDGGPGAQQTAGMFLRNTEYCRGVLHDHYERFGVDYVGEWHSHILPLRGPSMGDLATIAGIMHDPDYDFTTFALLIAVLANPAADEIEVDLLGYIAVPTAIYRTPIETSGAPTRLCSSEHEQDGAVSVIPTGTHDTDVTPT